MALLADTLFEQALNLPMADRLILIDKLLHSTNQPPPEDIDHAWCQEVERRCRKIDSGKAEMIPGDIVFARINQKYSK